MPEIFISHASKDDDFVKQLRVALESLRVPVWVDSRNLRGGDKLAPEIGAAIEQARSVIVVLSPTTVNSRWVGKEVRKGLRVERQKKGSGYRVIPLLLPGIEPSALANWFGREPVGIRVDLGPGGVSEALPQILAALGEQAPGDIQPAPEPPTRPVAELKLKLKGARIEEVGEGKSRVSATAQLIYDPPDSGPAPESREFKFTAPLGPIEADDLRWYLEEYYRWPTTFFAERAKRIEEQLPQWGRLLYDAATAADLARGLLADWQRSADGIERRFSIFVDSRLPEGSEEDQQTAANEAASALLSLPWELMHDGGGFLFQGANPVRVRRCLPKDRTKKAAPSSLPIRILLVSPRPEDESARYIDHRVSARPLVDAVESMGDMAELTVLDPPTFQALQKSLRRAGEVRCPFDVIHFDGHGVYDRQRGLGLLCFEHEEPDRLERRASQLIAAEELGALVREHRIPLVFLEACQSAAEERPAASVAAKLLDAGVTSVVAMTHSVLVQTARRFVTAFYAELAQGKRVGTAMLAGQEALYTDDFRDHVMGAGELRLKDWFVPVLYQEDEDPRLVTRLLPEAVKRLLDKRRRLSLGALPSSPAHGFVGRSRDLLGLERMLANTGQRYAVVRGRGGEGKTTLAVELARWLVQTRRFDRAAFVSLEEYSDARGLLDSLGRQLLPEGENWSVALFSDLKQARLEVERALRDHRTIIILDNMEGVLPDPATPAPPETSESKLQPAPASSESSEFKLQLAALFDLCTALLDADPATQLIFTSREPLPEPFSHNHRIAELRELDPGDAIELVSQVMKEAGLEPKHDDAGNTPQEITDLVEAVGCHARALMLLAREIALRGVSATTGNVQRLMEELDRRHPSDRENSLYASVELSLRRLPPQMQQQIKTLGVFHGGTNLWALTQVLGVDKQTATDIGEALVEVGLAERMPYRHLRLDPALPPHLLGRMSPEEREAAQSRWVGAMRELTMFLYDQKFQDAVASAHLARLELPNLMALLDWTEEHATPEEVVDLAERVETLLAELDRPQALARATHVREQAARHLGQGSEWSEAHFRAEAAKIERLQNGGRFEDACEAAQQLLVLSRAAGEAAYPGASYHMAMAHIILGMALRLGRHPEDALAPLAEAQRRLQALADLGNENAARMVPAAIVEGSLCLMDLGRLDDAESACRESIERAEQLGDRRAVADGKGRLGTVRLEQKRYTEALKAYTEARKAFESLGEPRSVARYWYQIGQAQSAAENFGEAEVAYRQSLAIDVREKNSSGEADTLNGLGSLYRAMGRLDEAVTCYRQAADIDARLGDRIGEGFDRNNLAGTLIKLERFDEARRDILRALECKSPYGHAANIWTTWSILHDLERATHHPQAAADARQRAIESYLAYRRDGGQSYEGRAQVCRVVALAIQTGAPSATIDLAQQLAEHLETETDLQARALPDALQAVLRGARDPALADDPVLNYRDAVELRLLLESLAAK